MPKGFRSGGFNLSGVAIGVATLVGAGVPGLPQGVRDSYDQEDTEGFEVGFKSTLAGGALRLDAALFDTEVANGFTFVFVAPFTAQTTRNIKAADVSGLETSLSWLATERLQLDLGLGFLDSEITASDWVGAGGISIIGKEMPQNPDSTANLGLVYRGQLGGDREWYARLDYRRLGEVYWEPENFVARDPLSLVDLRFGITSRAWLGGRRLGRQCDGRGLDLRGIESQRHRLLRQAAAVRRRDDLSVLEPRSAARSRITNGRIADTSPIAVR